MNRTDIHRPSAPEFDPQAYTFRGVYDLHPDPMMGGNVVSYRKAVADLLTRGYTWHGAPHGSGKCSHCGANLRYVGLMTHEATMTVLNVGETCLDNRFDLTKAEFRAAQARAAEARAKHSRLRAFNALWAEHPDLVWATYAENIAAAGQVVETVPMWFDQPNGPTMEQIKPGTAWVTQTRQEWAVNTLSDIARRARQYGELSDRQAALVSKLVRRLEAAEVDRSARQVAAAAALATRTNAYQGRLSERATWAGTVRDLFSFDGRFGRVTVVIIDTDGGALKWFASSGVKVDKGDAVTVTATVKNHEERDGERFTVVTRARLAAA